MYGHEATETGLAYAPVSQAHGHNHIVQWDVRGGGGSRGGLAVLTQGGTHSRRYTHKAVHTKGGL